MKSPYECKSVLYNVKVFDPLFQVKAIDDDKGIIQAYASKFDNVDEYKDVVLPGSYKRTLTNQRKSNRPYLYTYLYQHEPNLIFDGVKDANEDNVGLLYQAQCNMDTQLGRETYSNAKMGVLYQSSIGYDVPQGGSEYKDGIRYLKEIRLWEISLVTFAANPEATVVDVKTRPYEIQSKRDDSGKSGRDMDKKDKEKKTIAEHYAEETCKDLLKDWADVYLKIITQSVLDALKIGDQIEQDISQALDDWKEVVLSKFLAQAIECDLPGYISDNSDTYSSADSTMLYGSGSRYGYMSNEQDREEKAGKPISAANQKIIDDHVQSLRDTTDEASKAVKSMQDHVKALRTAADDLATRMQGAETPYTGNDPGKPDEGQQEGKAANRVIPPEKAHDTQERPSEEDTVNEEDLELFLSFVQGIKTA